MDQKGHAGTILIIFLPKASKNVANFNILAGSRIQTSKTCGQSYKASTIVNYYSRVVPDLKIPHITTLES